MSWYTTLTEQVRYIIGDLEGDSYSDIQLGKFLAIGARYVLGDLAEYETAIVGPYSVDTSLSDAAMISPDPLANGSPIGFSNLIVAKAVSLIAHNELRKEGAIGGWKIVDDKSVIDGSQSIAYLKEVKRVSDDIYTDTLLAFKTGEQGAGHAIFGPYASSNYPNLGARGQGPWYGYGYRSC